MEYLRRLSREDRGQDIAEYAVMLAVILVIVVGTVRLIGSHANNVFSNGASSIQYLARRLVAVPWSLSVFVGWTVNLLAAVHQLAWTQYPAIWLFESCAIL